MKKIAKIKSFFNETVGELKKSSWPTRKELIRSTAIVVVGMVLISLYVSVVDFSLFNIVDFISNCVRK